MPHAIGSFVAIKCFNATIEFGRVRPRKTTHDLFGRHEIFSSNINLDPIARAKQQRFTATAISQNAISLSITSKILACFYVRIVMAEADAE